MGTVGAGNFWDKKDKYSECPNCKKKGFYETSLVDNRNRIHRWSSCMFCKTHTQSTETHNDTCMCVECLK